MANQRARDLRKKLTPQEVKLWMRLRELRPLGFIFAGSRRSAHILSILNAVKHA
jgi:very-short-patch-repair endonuclease